MNRKIIQKFLVKILSAKSKNAIQKNTLFSKSVIIVFQTIKKECLSVKTERQTVN